MTQQDGVLLLAKNLGQATKAQRWLMRSYQKCQKIVFDHNLTDGEFDDLENLTSRFATAGATRRLLDEVLKPKATITNFRAMPSHHAR